MLEFVVDVAAVRDFENNCVRHPGKINTAVSKIPCFERKLKKNFESVRHKYVDVLLAK